MVALEQSFYETQVANQVIDKCFTLDNSAKWNVEFHLCILTQYFRI